MEYQNNAAGVTTITGLDDYLITGTLDQHGPMNGVLVNGTRYAYYAKYADIANGTDYETGQGTWSGDNTLSRDTITTSSNAGNSVNWGSGQKAIYIVADAELSTDMEQMVEGVTKKILTVSERSAIAASKTKTDLITVTQAVDLDQMETDISGALMESEVTSVSGIKTMVVPDSTTIGGFAKTLLDDADASAARTTLGVTANVTGTEVSSLSAATQFTGTENVAMLQAGVGRKATPDDFSGTAVVGLFNHSRTQARFATDFFGGVFGDSYTGTKTPIPGEHCVVTCSGTGARAAQNASLFGELRYGVLSLFSGTTSSGIAALNALFGTLIANSGGNYVDGRMVLKLSSTPTVGEDYSAVFGFATTMSALPTTGIFFLASSASPNWRAIVTNAGTATNVDTGIALTNTYKTLRVNINAGVLTFYIDGVSVATPALTNYPSVGSQLLPIAGIYKTAGATERVLHLDAMTLSYRNDNSSGAYL